MRHRDFTHLRKQIDDALLNGAEMTNGEFDELMALLDRFELVPFEPDDEYDANLKFDTQ